MNFKNVLWKYAQRKDGTHAIKIYANVGNQVKYFSTKCYVLAKDWDRNRQKVKKSHPLANAYNARIMSIRMKIEQHFFAGGTFQDFAKKDQDGSLLDYFAQVIEKANKQMLPLRPGTIRNYTACLNRLKYYCQERGLKDLSFSQIDLDFYRDIKGFLFNQCNCGIPGFSKHIKIIKRVMAMAQEEGLHNNEAYRDKGFKVFKHTSSNKIYLTVEEMERIEQLDLSSQPALERERDRFLLAYYFIQRFSDVVMLSKDKFFILNDQEYLKYKSVKTNLEATIPVKPAAKLILERYDYQINYSAHQLANRHIKSIVAMAGINSLASQDNKTMPKSSFVSMHTARRSAATNLYLGGMSLQMISALGGWRNADTLRLYLRASGLDSAVLASDAAFFQ